MHTSPELNGFDANKHTIQDDIIATFFPEEEVFISDKRHLTVSL